MDMLPPHHYPNNQQKISYLLKNKQTTHKITKNYQPIGSLEVDELFEARDRLREFTEMIGNIRSTGIRRDAIEHCNKLKISTINQLTLENVEKIVQNRIEKMIKNKRIKKNWSEEDVKILIWIVSKYSDYKTIHSIDKELDFADWKYIASLIPGVQGEHCMFKWLSLKKNNLSDHNWSEKQSTFLDRIVRKYGQKDWGLVAQKLYYLNPNPQRIYRCPKQCRQHWNCYLNPRLKKGPWSKDEDILLLNLIKKNNGLKKWAQMVCLFNGRTENALKNRFTLIMEKQTKLHPFSEKKMTQLELINKYLERSYVEQFVNIENEQKNEAGEKTKDKTEENKKDTKVFPKKKTTHLKSETQFKDEDSNKSEFQDDLFENNFCFFDQNDHFSPMREVELSEPQAIFFPNDDNQIFEEDSMPVYPTPTKTQDQISHINTVKVVQLDKSKLSDLKLTLLENNCEFVPCKVVENKLKKISY